MTIRGNALHWPALDVGGTELPAAIPSERGVWGKAHGAPTDFRWLAATPGLTAPQNQLERELALGAEDAPVRATLWRVLDDTCHAVSVYPSRAHDATGRSGFLEKQILEWKRPSSVPAAVGALLLLPAVEQLDATEWWEQRSDVRWSDDDAIVLSAVPPVPLTIAAIEAAVEAGLQSLTASIAEETLMGVYANILAGNRGVTLRGLDAPLSPYAVAALLLPLPRSVADRLSLAGWIPSTWLSESGAEDVRRCWDVLGGADVVASGVTVPPNEEQLDRARGMARAVFSGQPPHSQTERRTRRPHVPVNGVKPVQLALWGPSAAGKTALLAKLFLDAQDPDWSVYPTERSLEFIHNMRQRMRSGNHFPRATTVGTVEGIEYLFRHRDGRRTASLQLEDRAGAESERLEDGGNDNRMSLRQRLGSADGVVLLFDPLSDPATLESRVWRTLELLHVASGRLADKDDRPIAVCVSKADLLIEKPADFRRAVETPDEFVRARVDEVLVTALDRYCSNYRLFPLSVAGVRLRRGIVEPAVFFDESLEPRICPGGRSFNLMAPFSWLLDQLREAP